MSALRPCCFEYQERQENREEARRHPAGKEERIPIIRLKELPAVRETHPRRPWQRKRGLQDQKRKTRHPFPQRRVLGIDSEILPQPIPVAGQEVNPLVGSLRLLPYGERQLGNQNPYHAENGRESECPPRICE